MSTQFLLLDGTSNVTIAQNLMQALQNKGHTCHYIDIKNYNKKRFFAIRRHLARALTRQQSYYYYPKLSKSIEGEIVKTAPDTIIVTGFAYAYLSLTRLKQLKKQLKARLYLIDTDSGSLFEYPKKLAYFMRHELTNYDKVFCFSKKISDYMNKMEHHTVEWFPCGAEALPQTSVQTSAEKSCDVLFYGTPGGMRRIFCLEQLSDYNLEVYGKRWKNYKHVISNALFAKITHADIWGEHLIKTIHQSKIILNINSTQWHSIETGVNLRIFDILAMGGFLLTEHCEELNELFSIGQEFETFKSHEEMLDKVNYYLQHEDKRKRIAQAGHAKILRDFTWDKRVNQILKQPL